MLLVCRLAEKFTSSNCGGQILLSWWTEIVAVEQVQVSQSQNS